MKYSKPATENYAKKINKEECLEPIDQLITSQGYDENAVTFKKDDLVLNMDCVEAVISTIENRPLNKSMDSAFIIEDEAGRQEIVLVEYKVRMANIRNLSVDELLEKVSGSTSILETPPDLHENYYIVYRSDIKEQARRKLFRLHPRIPEKYIAMDMADVQHKFFD